MFKSNAQLKIDDITSQYRKNLPSKLAEIEQYISNLLKCKSQENTTKELLRLVHSLIGSSGTFGLPEVCLKARELENFIIEFNSKNKGKFVKKQIDRIWSCFLGVRIASERCLSELQQLNSANTENISKSEFTDLSPSKILLISDDEYFSKWLSEALINAKHDINIADRADDAFEVLSSSRFDFILSEISLPGASGIEIARLIRREFNANYTPIVFITSLDDESNKLNAIQAGGDSVLVKPVTIEIILATLFSIKRIIQQAKEKNT